MDADKSTHPVPPKRDVIVAPSVLLNNVECVNCVIQEKNIASGTFRF